MAWQTPKTNWQAADVVSKDDFNRIEGNIQELENTKETPAGAQTKVNTHAGSKQTHGISSGYYIAKTSRSDQLPAWNDIQGKPSLVTSSDLSNALAAKVDKPSSATSGNIAVFDGGAGKLKDGGKAVTDIYPDYIAGDNELISSTYLNVSTDNTWRRRGSFRLDRGGSLRISFDLRVNNTSYTAYGIIYRNGAPIGTQRSTTSTELVTFTEDIGGWEAGDTVDFYYRGSASSTSMQMTNMRIQVARIYTLAKV